MTDETEGCACCSPTASAPFDPQPERFVAGRQDCPCNRATTLAAPSPVHLPASRMALTSDGPDFAFVCTLDGGVDTMRVRFEARAPAEARDVVSAVFGVAAAGASPPSPPRPASRISRDELRSLLDRGSAVLVEALPHNQYEGEHLPGAVNVPDDRTEELAVHLVPAQDTTVVVYCSGPGCARSTTIAAAFTRLGYTDVHIYTGGKSDRAEAGLPFEGIRATVTA